MLGLQGKRNGVDNLLFAAKKLGEETRFSFVTLAALVLGDATHYLIDVLAAASPGCFSALSAGDFSTHLELLNSVFIIPLGV